MMYDEPEPVEKGSQCWADKVHHNVKDVRRGPTFWNRQTVAKWCAECGAIWRVPHTLEIPVKKAKKRDWWYGL